MAKVIMLLATCIATFGMMVGFLVAYSCVWDALGLPLTPWAPLVVMGADVLTVGCFWACVLVLGGDAGKGGEGA